jgi:NCS1 family nucleobase:cation symporter-1
MSSKSEAYESDILSLPDAAPNLINHELAPLKRQTWGTYNIFCYWMSDVHSVGGYVFAGSLFALALASWQVLICLLAGTRLSGWWPTKSPNQARNTVSPTP